MKMKKLIGCSILILAFLFLESAVSIVSAVENQLEEKCDIFTGKWVLDYKKHPLYKQEECEFLQDWENCIKNGRPDSLFQIWKWKPRDCSLPKFKAKKLLKKLRGKRLVYVGDSIHQNQWQSMVCMVQSAVPPGNKFMDYSAYPYVFRIQDYNASIEFHWAPYLVESSSDPPERRDGKTISVIMPKSISKHGDYWINADYLIFDSYAWWIKHPTVRILRGSFEKGDTEYYEMEQHVAFESSLNTWANWIDTNVDPTRTSVFFSTMSPIHDRSAGWNNPRAIKCSNETLPVMNTSMPLNLETDWEFYKIATKVIKSMKVKVQFLNITTLSEYRKDAHMSVYGAAKTDPANADCLHWCLPGLPDIWNELLYAYIH
ncbi:protein trichome birefringence-like 30 isoform X2 [Euphorbia lathyris]|uniref:protein trichome birefringence-like 30 isoform X2 n=1 Tax=Euphorbia lathyris TaxID=212925 RepID=UPI003313238A